MNAIAGAAGYLVGCCGAGLLISFLILLLVGQWVQPEALIPIWLSFLSVPVGLSFATLVPFRKRWPTADRMARIKIVFGCAGGLALVHWLVVALLLIAVAIG